MLTKVRKEIAFEYLIEEISDAIQYFSSLIGQSFEKFCQND